MKFNKPFKQSGVATIAILLFVGVAISVAVFGAFRAVEGSQSQAMTFHAQTQAQRKAWIGVDITSKYLSSLSSDNLETLIEALPSKSDSELSQQKLNAEVGDENIQLYIYKEEVGGDVFVYAEITGEAAKNSKAHATSTIEAVFEMQQSSTTETTSCSVNRTAVMRGVTNLTGGGTNFISGDALSDIAVEGSLTLGSSSKSGISGCASGDVTMSGGGIKDNATLLVGGEFKVDSMSQPNNASVWARDINIGNTGSGDYNFLRAGAYTTTVLDKTGIVIGKGDVGGKLITSTTKSSLPWISGTLIPTKNIPFVIEMDTGGQLLVDLSEAIIDEVSGFVTGHKYEVLEGEGSLPSTLQFEANNISGGSINIYDLNVNQLWGHSISADGYGANYNTVLSNGDFNMGAGDIGTLVGGGNLTASKGGCNSSSNCWNTPSFASPSEIAGLFNVPSYSGSVDLNNLTQQVSHLSPGLPGIPFCDTRVEQVVAEDFKTSANYIFEEIGTKRQLTIQNVTLSDGTELDGVYNLLTDDMRSFNGQQFLTCGWGNNHCFRDYSVWELDGISAFPPGVAWFDSSLKINGVGSNNAVSGIGNDLLNTLITVGNVELTSSGHGDIIAPNFDVVTLCQGNITPTNLCNQSGELVGDDNSGLPIANSAIVSEESLDVAGWSINGHVTLGSGITTTGAKVIINGGLVVGSNSDASTTVGQGGLEVNTQNLSEDQLQTSCTNDNGTNESTGIQLKGSGPIWTRYL
ncbi:hypothetical protein [Pseudoalteromonas sp. ZZD1]|uniref:hypothetical protein n=1 Tax=Pseudoalteromonas sp. ZZD1 TaxID=3139395 RepID=UPI003BAA7C22